MVQLNFNAAQVAPSGAFTVYESGVYDAMIVGSEFQPTKAKKAGQAQRGLLLWLTLKIISGPNNGGTLRTSINMENDNPTAEEIGQQELSAVCHVTGVMHLQDSQQLHGIPIKVQIIKKERGDGAKNPDGSPKFGNELAAWLNAAGTPADQLAAGKAGGGGGAAPMQAPVSAPQPPMQQQPPVQQWQPQPQPAEQPQQQPWAQQQPATQPPAPAQQPWQQQPVQQAPVEQQQQAPAATPPWQQEQAPAQVAQQQQQPAQQPVQQQAPAATPPWQQQPAGQQPAAASVPPWQQQPPAQG